MAAGVPAGQRLRRLEGQQRLRARYEGGTGAGAVEGATARANAGRRPAVRQHPDGVHLERRHGQHTAARRRSHGENSRERAASSLNIDRTVAGAVKLTFERR